MRILLACAAVAALVFLSAWFFEMPLEKAALVAPITVLAVGAAVGLLVLWTKVIVESVRGGGASPGSRAPGRERGSRTPTSS